MNHYLDLQSPMMFIISFVLDNQLFISTLIIYRAKTFNTNIVTHRFLAPLKHSLSFTKLERDIRYQVLFLLMRFL